MSQKCMAVYLTVSEIQRQKWSGGSFYPPLAGIRVKHTRASSRNGSLAVAIFDDLDLRAQGELQGELRVCRNAATCNGPLQVRGES